MSLEGSPTYWCEGGLTEIQPGPQATKIAGLTDWWIDLARTEAGRVVPKAIEYGADDLIEIGRELALAGVSTPDVSQEPEGEREIGEIYTELGIWFYLVGKMARWRSAVRRGERPSDDTIHDIGVYSRMAQRNRETGRWPG